MTFRKYINVFLAFFLLVSNLDLAFNVHYCEEKVASISINSFLNSNDAEKDCCGVVEKQSKCCNDKIIKSNEKQDQIVVKSFVFDAVLPFECWKPLVFKPNFTPENYIIKEYHCNTNAPPFYQLNSQYIFYA